MDTDGYADEKIKKITVMSSSLDLINQFHDFCKRNNVQTEVKKYNHGWLLTIFSDSILSYAKQIGFSHPRKREALIKHLKNGPSYKVLKKLNRKIPIKLIKVFKHLRPYKSSVYIKLNEYHRKAKKQDVKDLLNLIKNNFKVSIREVKRKRYNNHYYITSKRFLNFIKNNTVYDLPWQSLNNKELKVLSKEWAL